MTFHLPTTDPEQLYLYQGAKQAPPVDVDAIATALGIVRDNSFNPTRFGYSGEIFWRGGFPTVWINPADSLVRRRFTLAHEIGHFILHMQGNQDAKFKDDVKIMRRGGEWNGEEMQANRFAACLLMPKALIDREFEKARFWKPTKETLAKQFMVSEESMGYRLANLGRAAL